MLLIVSHCRVLLEITYNFSCNCVFLCFVNLTVIVLGVSFELLLITVAWIKSYRTPVLTHVLITQPSENLALAFVICLTYELFIILFE